MVICLQWEGRSYSEQSLKRDMMVCKEVFGIEKPIRVIGHDVGELFTADKVPDFTKVLTLRGGVALTSRYNVYRDGLMVAPFEDWTDPAQRADRFTDVEWKRVQNQDAWAKHASLPHFLWWMMEVDSIMQNR